MARDLQDLINETMPIEAQKQAREKADTMLEEIHFLNQLRKYCNMTQEELAKALGITQSNVSLTEKREYGVTMATISRFVKELGGNLELKVKFPDKGKTFKVVF